jgi:hypothetical protein
MAYSKAELKSNSDKAYPHFQPFFTGNMSEKKLLYRVLMLPFHKTVRYKRFDNRNEKGNA